MNHFMFLHVLNWIYPSTSEKPIYEQFISFSCNTFQIFSFDLSGIILERVRSPKKPKICL